jgi:site-specific recombinase XerD
MRRRVDHFKPAACMSEEPRVGSITSIRSAARKSERCVSYAARIWNLDTFSSPSGVGQPRPGFLKTIARTGEAAKLPFPIHPHMLRHSTGYKLANDGHDTRALQHYMGHKNIMHTVRYTEMAPDRFKNFWND